MRSKDLILVNNSGSVWQSKCSINVSYLCLSIWWLINIKPLAPGKYSKGLVLYVLSLYLDTSNRSPTRAAWAMGGSFPSAIRCPGVSSPGLVWKFCKDLSGLRFLLSPCLACLVGGFQTHGCNLAAAPPVLIPGRKEGQPEGPNSKAFSLWYLILYFWREVLSRDFHQYPTGPISSSSGWPHDMRRLAN